MQGTQCELGLSPAVRALVERAKRVCVVVTNADGSETPVDPTGPAVNQ